MPVEFIGMIGTKDQSETRVTCGPLPLVREEVAKRDAEKRDAEKRDAESAAVPA
jgi:hypothetical protein